MKLSWFGGSLAPLILSALLIQSLVTCNDEKIEYENDFDGNVAAASSELRVNVINEYDFPVEVYYEDSRGGILLMELEARMSGYMNTYAGHRFYVKRFANDASTLYRFAITPTTSEVLIQNKPLGVSTFSKKRRHPSVRDIPGPRTTATSAKFRSLSSRPIQIWYDNGTPELSFQGELTSGQETTTNAYVGHVFIFTEKANKANVLARHTITADQVLYLVRDPTHPADRKILEKTEREEKFMADYLNRTGIHWRHHYGLDGPRPPPVLHMWPAQEIGQIHKAESSNGHWTCQGTPAKCQGRDPISLEIEVVSLAPKVYIIPNFLNAFEADSIVGIANATVKASTVGSYDGGGVRADSTRTSRNTWISRNKSPLTETLFRRAADVLNVDQSLLHTSSNVEDIQVVHYVNGQKYDSHHDWGVSGYHESRYITMLMYLTDQADPDAGGETSFPKAGTGGGIKVVPVKGDAVLFYNLLEDGNGDDLSLHAALPVWRGEKWLANFWVWDPKRR